jgi:predicted metal-dependent hydrolase
MLPIRRDLHFDLPAERITDWHEQGPFITHFFNALSLLFPRASCFSWTACATTARASKTPR